MSENLPPMLQRERQFILQRRRPHIGTEPRDPGPWHMVINIVGTLIIVFVVLFAAFYVVLPHDGGRPPKPWSRYERQWLEAVLESSLGYTAVEAQCAISHLEQRGRTFREVVKPVGAGEGVDLNEVYDATRGCPSG